MPMWVARKVVPAGLLLIALAHPAHAAGGCDSQALQHQQKDAATIQQLENAWNIAISQGDTSFERCLLTPDFMEVLSTGEVKTAADELGFTAKNQGQKRPLPKVPHVTVLIHDNVAVAYATWKMSGTRPPDQTSDFFVWENGAWHAFFSQATPVETLNGREGDTQRHLHSLASLLPK